MSDNQPQVGTCPTCGSKDYVSKLCGGGLRDECPHGHQDCPDAWHEQHEEDCPCFGDTVEHSQDCKNCTCEKAAVPQPTPAEPRIETVPDELCGKVVAQVAGGGVLACDSPRGHAGLCTYTFPFQITNEPTRSHGPLCDNCGKSSRQHYCWTPVENQEVSTFHPSERRASPPSSPGAATEQDLRIMAANDRVAEHGRLNHKTVAVQVWADIDVGIVDLVRHLNTMPGVRTQASCQGESTGPAPYGPYVMATWAEEFEDYLVARFEVELLGNHWGYIKPKLSSPGAPQEQK